MRPIVTHVAWSIGLCVCLLVSSATSPDTAEPHSRPTTDAQCSAPRAYSCQHQMRPIVTHVAWSISLCVCLLLSSTTSPDTAEPHSSPTTDTQCPASTPIRQQGRVLEDCPRSTGYLDDKLSGLDLRFVKAWLWPWHQPPVALTSVAKRAGA